MSFLTPVTWSPADKSSTVTLSNSNLTATFTGSLTNQYVRATESVSSGKVYFELTISAMNASGAVGFGTSAATATSTANAVQVNSSGQYSINGAAYAALVGSIGVGAVTGWALDLNNHLFWVRPSAAGNWNGSSSNNPATGVGGISFSALTGAIFPLSITANSGNAFILNTGVNAFSGSVPSGFAAAATIASVTQVATEEWSSGAAAQVTQIAVEEWSSTTATSGQALVTQVLVEQWSKVPSAAVGHKRRHVTVAT